MKKVLLLDTNFSSAPSYNYILRSNYDVYVCGSNPNDFLAKTAKHYINQDYSDIDAIRSLIDLLHIDYIVPGCNDLSYQVCAELNTNGRFFGLDGADTAQLINNKRQFRQFAEQAGLPVPRIISTTAGGELWPIIVKPVDAYSGRGITVLQESEKNLLPKAIQHAKNFSRTKTCLLEEYIEGQLYSHSAFIADGEITIDFIVKEYGKANPFVVDTSRVIFEFTDDMLNNIRTAIIKLAKELNLSDGLVHTQFIKSGELFQLIEVTRRCPGDLYSQLIEYSTGFPYAETYVKPFLNQPATKEYTPLKRSYVLRHTISRPNKGVFGALCFNQALHIKNLVPLCLAGDLIEASPFGRIALLFLIADSEQEISRLMTLTLNRELYTIY